MKWTVILPFFFFFGGHIDCRVSGHLGSQQRALCPSYTDSGLPSLASSDIRVPGVLDKAREDPLCGTHALPLIPVQPLSCLDCHGWTISFSPEVSSFLHFCLWVSKHFLNIRPWSGVVVQSPRHVRLLGTPWTVARQASLSSPSP